jgi:hypothetical protein
MANKTTVAVKAKRNAGGLSFAQQTMELSVDSVEMAELREEKKEQATAKTFGLG